MKRSCTYPLRLVGIVIISFFYLQGSAQVIPQDETYGGYTSNVALTTRLVSFSQNAALPLSYAFVSPATVTGSSFMFLGLTPGSIFRPSNRAFYFNYTTGGAVPGVGQTGGGDYRISFSKDTDTTQKKGNFGMQSMYLAIGAGNTSDVKIQGFRAGKLVAEATITGLSTNDAGLNSNSPMDLSYSSSDDYSGVTVSFGTNWQFLDGIRFVIPSADIPLSVDDLSFNSPSDVAPGTQASSIGFTNSTGVSSQVNWTGGSGDSVLLFMAAANSGNASPAAHTLYKSNSTFGSGDQAGTGWFCVYRGADGGSPSASVFGLTPGTTYRTMAVSFNGAVGWEDYHATVSTNINNFTTIAIPTTQASNITVSPDFTDFKKASINWTRGNGAKCAVFVRNNTSSTDATVAPLNNNNNADASHHTYSAFTDSTSVTSNGRVGSSGWYCVFNGAASGTGLPAAVTMTKISTRPGQTLRVMVVEYNGTAGAETYNITSASSNVVDYFNPDFPLPVTNAANAITTAGATFNGTIDPRNANITSGTYVYSNNSLLSPVLGTITTLTPTATSILGSASPTAVAATVTGLSPSTTYYYRLSAVSNAGALTATNNTGGASNGIMSFITAPVVNSVSASTANGSYKAGNVVIVTVGFTSAVTVTGTPTITLNTGAVVNYTSGSGTSTLSFNYTISPTQTSNDLDYTTTSALLLAGGTIKDQNGNDALLTLPTVGGASSLGGQKNIIIDTQIPLVTTATIASNNASPTIAKPGDIVTLSFISNETIQTPVVTIAGNTVSATTTGSNNWTAAYTMTGNDPSGNISFSIPFNDIAGNAGVTLTATTNSSSVTFDKTAPVISPVTITSNNTNTAFAKTGNIVTVSFTASKTISTPVVTIRGNTASVTNTTGNNWTAVYTMTAADESGIIPFTISAPVDAAGNTGIAVTATTNGSSVVYDKIVPSLTSVSIASNNTNTSLAKTGNIITVSFTASETINTPIVTIRGNAASVTNTTGNNWTAVYTMAAADESGIIPFNITAPVDAAGNTGTAVTATTNGSSVVYDKIAPSLTSVSIASNNTTTSLAKTGNIITVSFTAIEKINTPTVTIRGNAASVTNTTGNNWTAIYTMAAADESGTVPFSISAPVDPSGNTGTTVTASSNNTSVVYDKTAPILSSVSIVSNNTTTAVARTGNIVTVTFTANETITTPSVTIAGNTVSPSNTSGNNWTASYTMKDTDAAGTIAFSIAFTDLAGNSGIAVITSTNSSNVLFDKTNPTTPVTPASFSFTNGILIPVTVCQDATDRNVSNLLQISGATAGALYTWTVTSQPAHGTLAGFPATATATSTIVIPSGLIYKPTGGYSGTDAFTVSVSNGTASVTSTLNITINALPAVTVSSPQGTILCGTLTLQAAGGTNYAWSKDGAGISATGAQLSISSTGTYTVSATNAGGCAAAATNSIVITQLQKPVVAFIFDSYCTNKPVTFTNQSTTANSGPVTYLWSDGTNTSTNTSPVFTYTQPGTFNMKLTVTPTGCPAMAESLTKAVAVEAPNAAVRMAPINIAANSPLTLQARTFGSTYTWTPATGLSNANIAAPLASITAEQEYKISIGTASGCVTVDTLLLRIFTSAGIILPNVFSPNGDGVNDNLLPNLVDVRVFQYFRVFNRAGKKVFESNDPNKGWDGKVNGERQPSGTYMWSAAGLDKNGNIVHKEGSITLLR